MDEFGDRSSLQLSALAEVSDSLQKAGIAYWLFGGWAVDFYIGSVTRLHDDVDLAVWFVDAPQIANVLLSSGWRHAPDEDEDGGTGFERGGIRLELTYLVRGEQGEPLIPLRAGPVAWSARKSLADDVAELRGVRSRLISFESLLDGKSNARDDQEDGAKDRADYAQLSRLRE